MDFLDPAKKKAHSRRLFFGYLLMALALAFGTYILWIRTSGYGYDRRTGEIIQNGLVYVSAHPESAKVILNGKEKDSTNSKLTIPAGRYTLKLTRDGYRPWQKTFVLDGGSVEQLVYPLLFPVKLVRSDLKLFSRMPSFATVSPNRKRLLIANPDKLTNLDLFDLGKPKTDPAAINLSNNLFHQSRGAHSLSLVEWSTDNRHLLVRHKYQDGFEFIIIDIRTPSLSFNINKTVSATPTYVVLRNGRYSSFYLHFSDTKRLQTADLNNPKQTTFINSVTAFKAYGKSQIVYVTDRGAPTGKVLVKIKDESGSYNLRTLPRANNYLLDMMKYNGQTLVVTGAPTENHAYIYKDPIKILKQRDPALLPPAVILRINKPASVSFSKNKRFIALEHDTNFAVYDAETDRRFYYSIGSAPDGHQPAVWIDGYHLSAVVKNKVFIFDFDGFNKRFLTSAQPGLNAFFNSDYKQMFTLGPSTVVSKKPALTVTNLTVSN